jgi:hypothetical protein
MRHRTTYTNLSKIWNLQLRPTRPSLTALTHRIFAASDTEARQRGWRVSSTRGGFGRSYRDPRFDTLASSPPNGLA